MEMWEGNRTFLVQSTKGERLVKTKKAVTTGSMHTPVDVQDPRRAWLIMKCGPCSQGLGNGNNPEDAILEYNSSVQFSGSVVSDSL